MDIRTISNEALWTDFFNHTGSATFLQSWEWGEMQQQLKTEIIRIGIYDNNRLTGICQVIIVRSIRARFLFVPHGPIFSTGISDLRIQELMKALVSHLKTIATGRKLDFIRIAPVMESSDENQEMFNTLGFKTAPIYMHAERVWRLVLNKPESDLLANMRKSTRYAINRALRDGVIVEKRTDAHAITDFMKIYMQTAKRENFVPFSEQFIKSEIESFAKNNNAVFFFAKYQKELIAAALVIFTKSTGFYHQGATIHSKIAGSHLLQYVAIREAKKRGCSYYNFWGVYQEGRTPKSWQGLSLFKQGFGGKQIDYIKTQDYVISTPRYLLNYLYEQYLKYKRGI